MWDMDNKNDSEKIDRDDEDAMLHIDVENELIRLNREWRTVGKNGDEGENLINGKWFMIYDLKFSL